MQALQHVLPRLSVLTVFTYARNMGRVLMTKPKISKIIRGIVNGQVIFRKITTKIED